MRPRFPPVVLWPNPRTQRVSFLRRLAQSVRQRQHLSIGLLAVHGPLSLLHFPLPLPLRLRLVLLVEFPSISMTSFASSSGFALPSSSVSVTSVELLYIHTPNQNKNPTLVMLLGSNSDIYFDLLVMTLMKVIDDFVRISMIRL